MNILLLNTSDYSPEFAYCENGEVIVQKQFRNVKNADSLIYNIAKAFEITGKSMMNLDYVSISNGPGSFTGLRVGQAIAKAICNAASGRMITVNSLDIISTKYSQVYKDSILVTPIIPANTRNQEFYFADYSVSENYSKRLGEYSVDILDNLKFKKLITNEKIETIDFDVLADLSEVSNINAHLKLTLEYIENEMFINYHTSEPYYLKNFSPIKN